MLNNKIINIFNKLPLSQQVEYLHRIREVENRDAIDRILELNKRVDEIILKEQR